MVNIFYLQMKMITESIIWIIKRYHLWRAIISGVNEYTVWSKSLLGRNILTNGKKSTIITLLKKYQSLKPGYRKVYDWYNTKR